MSDEDTGLRANPRARRRILGLFCILAAGLAVLLASRLAHDGAGDMPRTRPPAAGLETRREGSADEARLSGRGPEATPESTPWRVRGRVDSHFSGLPVPGALVRLEANGASSVTDAAGEFHFDVSAEREAVVVQVSCEGYQPATTQAFASAAGVLRVSLRPASGVRLRVTTRDGDPVSGALVTFWRRGSSGSLEPASEATSREDGSLEVAWPTRADGGPARSIVADALTSDNAWGSIVLAAPPREERILELTPATALVRIRPGIWPTIPPGEAEVTLKWQPESQPGLHVGGLPWRHVGTVRVRQQDEESRHVRVPAGIVGARVELDAAGWIARFSDRVTTSAGRLSTFEISPRRGWVVGGSGPMIRLDAEVVDEHGDPVWGAHVGIRLPGDREPPYGSPTDRAGRVTVTRAGEAVEEGDVVHAYMEHPEYRPTEETIGRMESDGLQAARRFVLVRGPPRTDVLRLRVVGADGAALPGAVAWWSDDTGRLAEDVEGLRPTAPGGATHVLGPFDADWEEDYLEALGLNRLVFGHPTHRLETLSWAELSEHLGSAQILTVKLSPRPRVDVRVVDADGSPVPGARVITSCVNGGTSRADVANPDRFTDSQGMARVWVPTERGKDTWIIALHDEAGATARPWREGTETVTIKLSGAAALRGILRDESGRPVGGEPVSAFTTVPGVHRPSLFWKVRTAPDGSFAFDALPVGLLVAVQAVIPQDEMRYHFLAASRELIAGDESVIELHLAPP